MKKWILILGVLISPPLFGQEIKEDPEDCKKALEAFRTQYKSGPEASRAAAASSLSKHVCPKAVDALAQLLAAEADTVRIAAAKTLGGFDLPKAVEALASAVPANSQRHEVLEAIAKAIETLDWEVGAESLNPLLGKHHDKDVLETLHVVVPVLGKIGSPTSVEPLIKLLEHAENEGKRVRAAGVRAAGNPKMLALEAPIRKALQEITGATEATADKWDDWWKANRERALAGATPVYRCKAIGKRWAQKAGEPMACPFHDRPEKDGQLVKTRLSGGKSQ
jgi:HEAT repeat protein